MNLRKLTSMLLTAAVFACSLFFINTEEVLADASGTNVQYHSQGAIRCFMLMHGYGNFPADSYASDPLTTAPYAFGQLSSESESTALNYFNMIRYVAGLGYNVTADSTYSSRAQAAALICAANGYLSHSPSRPEGMSDDMYSLARSGAGSCNLYSGMRSIENAVVGWMSDSDDYNIEMVGHRRWILNPTLGRTGFGGVNHFHAMYCFDYSDSSGYNTHGVAWPAQNQPTQLFNRNDAWSFSVGSNVDMNSVHVTVTDNATGQVWNFSSSGSDGYFNVNNAGYGQSGCIIFRPNGIDVSHGKSYNVSITGAGDNINYNVNFFDIYSITDLEDDFSIDYSHPGQPMFRCYNPNSGEHFYTSNFIEVTTIVNVGWNYEGVGWYAPATSNTPVYRLYNQYGGEHHYTTSEAERDMLVEAGWTFEMVGWYSDDSRTVPLYREYNPNAFANNHNYTTSGGEHNYLISLGWRDEGIGWYGI